MSSLRQSQLAGRSRLALLGSRAEASRQDMDELRGRFDRLADPTSTPKAFSGFNLFQTPEALAYRMACLLGLRGGERILEPSAGLGRLLAAVRVWQPSADLVAVEIEQDMASHLLRAFGCHVDCADFLTWSGGDFDRVIMNPPFKMGTDIKHITRAASMLRPGGRLVSVCANGPKQRKALMPIASEWIDLPPGSFRECGTNVDAALFVLDT